MKGKIGKKEKKTHKVSRIANALSITASIILGLFGIFAVIFSSQIYEASKSIPKVTQGFVLTYGIIWIILGILVFLMNKSALKSDDKAKKWFLLVLGVACLLTGRLEGILVIISAALYFKR